MRTLCWDGSLGEQLIPFLKVFIKNPSGLVVLSLEALLPQDLNILASISTGV